MSDHTLKTVYPVSQPIEPRQARANGVQTDVDAQNQSRLSQTARRKALRIALRVDDGFRPFRVF